MRRTRDLISSACLFLLAAIYYLGAGELPSGQGEPGPAFFPTLLAAALALLSVVIGLRGWRQQAAPPTEPAKLGRPALVGLWTSLYAVALLAIGLVPSTFLYTLLMSQTIGTTGRRAAILVPVLSTVVIYLLFDWGFELMLPPPFWAP